MCTRNKNSHTVHIAVALPKKWVSKYIAIQSIRYLRKTCNLRCTKDTLVLKILTFYQTNYPFKNYLFSLLLFIIVALLVPNVLLLNNLRVTRKTDREPSLLYLNKKRHRMELMIDGSETCKVMKYAVKCLRIFWYTYVEG